MRRDQFSMYFIAGLLIDMGTDLVTHCIDSDSDMAPVPALHRKCTRRRKRKANVNIRPRKPQSVKE